MYRVENVATSRLKDYENNPRNNEVAVDKVAASIKRLGFLFPIIIDINYVIICGHTRKKACEQLGIKNVPCIKIDDLSPEQIRYFRLVDNRTSEYASWDFAKLEEELKLIDLDVVENYLLLETFDLDTALTEFDNEMEDIKIEGNNFLFPISDNISDNIEHQENETTYIGNDDNADNSAVETYNVSNSDKPYDVDRGIHSGDVNGEDSTNEQENKSKSPTVSLFEVGKIRFFISKAELDMLNQAYTKYLDTVYPAKTFIDFLLED